MRRISIACVVLAAGCSCGGTQDASLAPPRDARPAAAVGYEVHEWGLIRAGAGDVLLVGAIAPPRAPEVIAIDKPVLYFHADAALRLERVAVDARGGAIVEAWPSPPRTGDASQLVWRDVEIDPSGAACEPTPLPTLADAACTSLPPGEVCEVASLATARVPGVACVRTAEGTDSLLFCRERTRAFTPPLRFARRGAAHDEIEVTNEGDAPIPGWLVRLRDEGGAVRALALRPPAPHRTIVVGHDFDAAAAAAQAQADDVLVPSDRRGAAVSSPEPGRAAVRDTLRELGLTDGEAAAFLRSWDDTLFGVGGTAPADGPVAVDELTVDGDGLLAARESFLYFLPESACEDVSHLDLRPPPRAIRRALAVWSPIRTSGSSR